MHMCLHTRTYICGSFLLHHWNEIRNVSNWVEWFQFTMVRTFEMQLMNFRITKPINNFEIDRNSGLLNQ